MKALLLGGNGQTASYLAELLLDKDYEIVFGCRRVSVDSTERIRKSLKSPNTKLIQADVTDFSSLLYLIQNERPDHIYNFAAQSNVGTSFKNPITTTEIVQLGHLNLLEAVRFLKDQGSSFSSLTCGYNPRIYYACSSEQFGRAAHMDEDGTLYQDENTKFIPQSPYAIAKVAAYHYNRLYREAYGMNTRSGILNNHETIASNMPLIYKLNGKIDIRPIGDIVEHYSDIEFDRSLNKYQEGRPIKNLQVWDKNGWTEVTWVSGYKHKFDKQPRIINARNSVYFATSDHICIMEDEEEKKTGQLKIGDKIDNVEYPKLFGIDTYDTYGEEVAEFVGMLVGDGCISKKSAVRITGKDSVNRAKELWEIFTGSNNYYEFQSKSGFGGEDVPYVDFKIVDTIFQDFDCDVYNHEKNIFGHKTKKVPYYILNNSLDIMESFLVGYYRCDGLKAGGATSRFKNFKTNSATLAQGLLYLFNCVTGQDFNITVEESWKHGKQQFYYSVNLLYEGLSSIEKYDIIKPMLDKGVAQRKIYRDTKISRGFIKKVNRGYKPQETHHLKLPSNEVKKIIDVPNYDGWFFDLETKSGTFNVGIGLTHIHNSPKRGSDFVTRKITLWLGHLVHWLKQNGHCAAYDNITIREDSIRSGYTGNCFKKLRLGNISTSRAFGHAKDYCQAIILMMEAKDNDDYVVSNNDSHTVEEFLRLAFEYAGFPITNIDDFVYIDPDLYRPAEVDYLRGDYTKIKEKLGWEPTIGFHQLVKEMVQSDIKRTAHE